MNNKLGQVTIFIIVAIVIVLGIVAYFMLRTGVESSLSVEVQPVYDYYLSCLEETSREGIHLLGEQGGRIEIPDFEPGSAYMPFSSQLDFFGQPIPYWMYVSGNNLLREDVPLKSEMEQELEDYVSERLYDCDFSNFEMAGFDVYVEGDSVSAKIKDLNVDLNVNTKLTIYYENQSAIVSGHEVSVDSKLGKFYDMALDVYNFEKSNMFLEKYALDVMRLYAPVTGTEMSCTPKIFVDEEIREDIVEGLVGTVSSLKLKGNYYDLSSQERDYFVTDAGFNVDENVTFVYSSDWPTRVEIYGDRVAKPVGLQEGMGILGFCYVPYHLVYDINFPVLVQFYDNEEVFQFPIGVVIAKNQAREALPTTSGTYIESRVCEFKNQDVDVYTYDRDLNPIEARVQFKCLDAVCEIGETKIEGDDAILKGKFPQCVNGFIFASAKGFADAKYQISTNEEMVATIVLNKKYKVDLDLSPRDDSGEPDYIDKALVTFSAEDYSASVLYPEMDSVELIESDYNVTVHVYDDSSLQFPSVTKSECVDVPETGLAGLFGAEKEKCYDVSLPAMDVSFAVVGGGNTREYITAGQLADAQELNINVPLFGLPENLEELQANYIRVDDEIIFLEFE